MEGIEKAVAPDDGQQKRKEFPSNRQRQPRNRRKKRHHHCPLLHHAEVHVAAAGPKGTKKYPYFFPVDIHLPASL